MKQESAKQVITRISTHVKDVFTFVDFAVIFVTLVTWWASLWVTLNCNVGYCKQLTWLIPLIILSWSYVQNNIQESSHRALPRNIFLLGHSLLAISLLQVKIHCYIGSLHWRQQQESTATETEAPSRSSFTFLN